MLNSWAPPLLPAGMFAGSALLGLHMAATHSTTLSMLASYMPAGDVAGLGKISGTAVSFTDLILGKQGAGLFAPLACLLGQCICFARRGRPDV